MAIKQCVYCNGKGTVKRKTMVAGKEVEVDVECMYCWGVGSVGRSDDDQDSPPNTVGAFDSPFKTFGWILLAVSWLPFTPKGSVRPEPVAIDTVVPATYHINFDATSQFLVIGDSWEEYHRHVQVLAFEDVVGLGGWNENMGPVLYRNVVWRDINDSTRVGVIGGGKVRMEWQRREGENAMWIMFPDFQLRLYEFNRDTFLENPALSLPERH